MLTLSGCECYFVVLASLNDCCRCAAADVLFAQYTLNAYTRLKEQIKESARNFIKLVTCFFECTFPDKLNEATKNGENDALCVYFNQIGMRAIGVVDFWQVLFDWIHTTEK